MIVKTEAVIIKSKKYGDTSKIITLYTKEFGKISAIAKGSRSKNNKFGGSLEPMCYVSLVLYKYQNRELQYISQSSLIDYFHSIHNDFAKMSACMAILEIVNYVVHNEEKHEEFFQLILNTLKSLDTAKNDFERFLIYFELRLAGIFGFQPDFTHCNICEKEIDDNYFEDQNGFNIENGCVLCGKCCEKSLFPLKRISLPAIKNFRNFAILDESEISKVVIEIRVLNEMFTLIHAYLNHHISGMRNLKSLEIFSNFK